jgi:beta-N-acetylhexosaminidase
MRTIRLLLAFAGLLSIATTLHAQKRLDRMMGQMILVGFRGTEAPPESQIIRDIKTYQLGGVVLFDYDVQTKQYVRNVSSPDQMRQLTAQLQAAADPGMPLLIGIDQEGGLVNRLKTNYGFPASITADSLGRLNNLDSTRARAAVTARTLRAAGINLNFAPSVDLNLNPEKSIIGKKKRSLGADPVRVSEQARVIIQTHHAAGIVTSIKHFPGHGSATGDTHEGFVNATKEWQTTEGEPYRLLIASGDCDIVMTSHIFNENLDPKYPATLSHNTLDGLLRRQYGWDGVIISDDMQMGALAKNYGFDTSIELAVNAGVDILLFGNNLEYDPLIAERAFTTLKRLVDEGKISKKRIKKSYKRIKKMKRRLAK